MNKIIIFIVLGISLASCRMHQIPDIHLEEVLARELIANNQLASLDFCDKTIIRINWDSILVIGPYCPVASLKNIKIKNFDKIAPQITVETEEKVEIFLVKNSICVAHSAIPRSIVDFSGLKKQGRSCFALIERRNCIKKLRYNHKEKWVYLED